MRMLCESMAALDSQYQKSTRPGPNMDFLSSVL